MNNAKRASISIVGTAMILLAAALVCDRSFADSTGDSTDGSSSATQPTSRPADAGAANDARIASTSLKVSSLKTLLMSFELDNGRYPTQEEGLAALVKNPGNLPMWHQYVTELPTDSWGHPLVYKIPGKEAGTPDVYSCGPNGIDDNDSGDDVD